ncbi:hypothetical protein [Flavobacterium kingsejongi]|nr:hypothetical protein [Flavobacterium kingsejongi]
MRKNEIKLKIMSLGLWLIENPASPEYGIILRDKQNLEKLLKENDNE